MAEKVKTIIVLGEHDQKFRAEFAKAVHTVHSMKEAIELASKVSQAGDQVLLSPACASFDLFSNYEDRGDQFRQAVQDL